MSVLPRVTELTRERISREFDDLGPDACMAEIEADLREHNPELLDMASRWAAGERRSEQPHDGIRHVLQAAGRGSARLRLRLQAAFTCCRAFPSRSATPSSSASTAPMARRSRTRRSTISKPAIPNSCRWLTDMRRGDRTMRRTMQGFALLHEALLIQSRRDQASRH